MSNFDKAKNFPCFFIKIDMPKNPLLSYRGRTYILLNLYKQNLKICCKVSGHLYSANLLHLS